MIQQLDVGGAERILLTLADAARDAGHTTAVATAGTGAWDNDFAGRRFDLPLLSRRRRRMPVAVYRLSAAAREFRPDVVHAHNPGMAMVTALATARGAITPALVSVHGSAEGDYAAVARVLRLGGLPVVACGPGVAAALAEYGFRVRQTIVNGVGAPPICADLEALRLKLGVPAAVPMLAAVGRLEPVKNHALAVHALIDLPTAWLVLVGEGSTRPELVARARRLRVDDRVVLAGRRADARCVMAAADAVVMPSRSEGLPVAAIEALASGTPLVATNVRGLREILLDGVNALLVHPERPHELALAVRRIIEDRVLAADLSSAARATAREFSAETMARQYLDMYQEVAQPCRH